MTIGPALEVMMERLGQHIADAARSSGAIPTQEAPFNHISCPDKLSVRVPETALTGGRPLGDEERDAVWDILKHAIAKAGFGTQSTKLAGDVVNMELEVTRKGRVMVSANYHIQSTSLQRLSESWNSIRGYALEMAAAVDAKPVQARRSRA